MIFFLIVFLFLALRFKVSGGEFYCLDQVKEDNKQTFYAVSESLFLCSSYVCHS